MAKYSDWRSDLREVIDDDTDNKKVTGKGCDNKKLIKINPKLGEAVEQIGGQILEVAEVDTVDGEEEDKAKKFEKEKQDKIEDKNKKKEMMLKKRIVRMKMMAVNQGAGDSLVAHHEPEGEMVESAVLDANKKIKKQEQRKKDEKEYARLMAILAHQKDLKKRGLGEEALDERLGGKGYSKQAAASSVYPGKKGTGDWEDSDRGSGNKSARRAGKKVEKKSPTYRAYVLNKEEVVDESKGHKGDDSFIEGETGSKIARRNLTRAMSSTKKGMGKPAADTIKRRERHQADRGVKTKGTKAGHSGSAYPKMSKTLDDTYPHKKEARLKAKLDARKSGEKYVDHTHHSLKKKTVGEKLPKVNEGVMKFIKDRVGGKKKPEKKAEMDKTTEKLHDLRKDKFKTDKQKEHEKYVNFLPVDEAVKGQDTEMRKVKADERKAGTDPKNTEDPTGKNYAKGQRASVSWWKDKTKVQKEEVVTELNRYGKETGKATGSLNKRPGSPVATRNQPNSAVNIVRRNIIRPQTGRPEGQQKKVKGEKGRVQPGDRKFTPAQTISRMRAQVAAADAAMRDTRGT